MVVARVLGPLLALFMAAAAVAWSQEPPPESLPSDTVALVGSEPILKADFDHWMIIATASSRLEAVPEPGTEDHDLLLGQVMSVLTSLKWIEGEAVERGIVVSDRAVRRAFRRQKRLSFPRERAYRRFLRESKQTEADILARVRSDMLSNRLRRQIVKGAPTQRRAQRRLDRFVKRFRRKWIARTICGEGYSTEIYCGSTVPIAVPIP
jgi:hypothetical protein